MGGGTKRAKVPRQDPEPSPEPLDVEILEKERARRAQKVRQYGRASTILTEGGLGSAEQASRKGTLLGETA